MNFSKNSSVHLPFFIAKRYLFSKKSHNVINIISIISATGICIGSMALIVILSVYNGFDSIIKSFYEKHQPDFVITAAKGKSFSAGEKEILQLLESDEFRYKAQVVEEYVFLSYGEREAIATITGVDSLYGAESGVDEELTEGDFSLMRGEIPHAVVGAELAAQLRLRTRFLESLELYFPDTESGGMALNTATLYPSGIISMDKEFDQGGLFVPISIARSLLGYAPSEVNSIELYLNNPQDAKKAEKELDYLLGPADLSELAAAHGGYVLKNRYEQNETLYKMMRSERFAVFLILFFVIIIISVNIFGSLSMLMLDKRDDMQTYRAMGASPSMVSRIFVLQGWLISLIGAAVGIAAGLLLCYLQKELGIISLPGNYIINQYPVEVHLSDVLITFFGIAVVGYLIAVLPVRRSKEIF